MKMKHTQSFYNQALHPHMYAGQCLTPLAASGSKLLKVQHFHHVMKCTLKETVSFKKSCFVSRNLEALGKADSLSPALKHTGLGRDHPCWLMSNLPKGTVKSRFSTKPPWLNTG